MENNIYDKIRHIDEKSNEYWMARELATAIGYKDYRNFKGLIEKAQKLCSIILMSSLDLRDRNIDPKERAFVMFMRLQE